MYVHVDFSKHTFTCEMCESIMAHARLTILAQIW